MIMGELYDEKDDNHSGQPGAARWAQNGTHHCWHFPPQTAEYWMRQEPEP